MRKSLFCVPNDEQAEKPSIKFPRSRILQFYREHPKWHQSGQRFGQLFYDWMELEKTTRSADQALCSRLYNSDSMTAQQLVIQYTDWET